LLDAELIRTESTHNNTHYYITAAGKETLNLLKDKISDAIELDLSVVELKATDDGYHLYKSVGFAEDSSGYRFMKWRNQ